MIDTPRLLAHGQATFTQPKGGEPERIGFGYDLPEPKMTCRASVAPLRVPGRAGDPGLKREKAPKNVAQNGALPATFRLRASAKTVGHVRIFCDGHPAPTALMEEPHRMALTPPGSKRIIMALTV